MERAEPSTIAIAAIDIGCVEILHLRFGDFANLITGDRSSGFLARSLRTGLDLGVLLEKIAHRRLLHRKSEGLVLEIGNDTGNWHSLFHFLRGGIKRLAEFHNVDAALTKCGSDGWRRIGRPAGTCSLRWPATS